MFMAKRGGLGQRGLDLLISASPGRAEQSAVEETTEKEVSSKPVSKRGTTTNTKTSGGSSAKKAGTAGRGTGSGRTGKTAGKAAKTNSKSAFAKNKGANKASEKAGIAMETTGAGSVLNEPLQIPIEQIEPNRSQPRKIFEEDSLQELADSIRQFGVIQPLIVQKKEDYYEIIAGERRWRAARIAGLKKLPVIVKDYSPREVTEISLIENIQREDLNPIEEAAAYKHLMEEYHLRQDEVAERVSKSRAAVANSVRLLNLDKRVQEMVVSEMLSTGHARALLAITDPELQYGTAQKVFDEKLSVREDEKLVRRLQEDPKPPKKPAVSEMLLTVYAGMEEDLKTSLGTKVRIAPKNAQKGRIEIEYYSADDLDRLCAMLKLQASETGR